MAGPELLFRGARVVDPAGGRDGVADVLVRDGVVAEVGPDAGSASAEVIDADGLVLAPGLVDMPTHLREPGFERRELVVPLEQLHGATLRRRVPAHQPGARPLTSGRAGGV